MQTAIIADDTARCGGLPRVQSAAAGVCCAQQEGTAMTSATRSSEPPPHAPAARRDLRRLAVELVGVVLVKIALLLVVYYAFFAPYPRPDTRPAAIERTLAPTRGN